jgi:hypothetical protein
MANFKILKITKEEAFAQNGTGNWGVKLIDGYTIAWECPMLGDGGLSSDPSTLSRLLACYAMADGDDPLYAEDGPDDILFQQGEEYFLMEVSY